VSIAFVSHSNFKDLRFIYLSHLWAKCVHILCAIYVLYIVPRYYVISVQYCVLSEVKMSKMLPQHVQQFFFQILIFHSGHIVWHTVV